MYRIAVLLLSIILLVSCSAPPPVELPPEQPLTATPPAAESEQSNAPPSLESPSSDVEEQSVAVEAEPATENKAPAVELGDAGVVADFHAPGNMKYSIGNIVQDEDSGQWAVLYAVSSYTGDDWQVRKFETT